MRAELHISGSEDTCLHDLVVEIAEPFNSWEEPDGFVLIYTSPEAAKDAFNKLHDKLYNLHPLLIGHPDGVTIEDDVLHFKGCEVWIKRSYESKAIAVVGVFFRPLVFGWRSSNLV